MKMKPNSKIPSSAHYFLQSAFAKEGKLIATSDVINWLREQNERVKVSVKRIRFDQMDQWALNPQKGNLQHKSGKFFSIDGIHVKTNWGSVQEWEQPIINQPEIGYLGFITKKFDGVLHFLMQAKIEPGNINYVQLSPTLQATRSNYTQIHAGKKPLYLEYFQQVSPRNVLLDQIQSEQGARFLKKRNRNIIINVDEDIPVYDNFVWLTLAQIKELLRVSNLVNMDSRTVISGIMFSSIGDASADYYSLFGRDKSEYPVGGQFLRSALADDGALHDIDEIISFLTNLKSIYDLEVSTVPLTQLQKWTVSDDMIFHEDHKYFKVIAVDIEIGNREVAKWSQPLIEPAQEGLCAFVVKEINGILHFAVQAKLECGNHDIFEFAPTVQCLTGPYARTKEEKTDGEVLPFLEYVLNAKPEQIIFDTLQSEEGGRFFREQNRNMIVKADDLPVELPSNYIWMTLNQLYTFLKFNNYLNIQARSLIAAIRFI